MGFSLVFFRETRSSDSIIQSHASCLIWKAHFGLIPQHLSLLDEEHQQKLLHDTLNEMVDESDVVKKDWALVSHQLAFKFINSTRRAWLVFVLYVCKTVLLYVYHPKSSWSPFTTAVIATEIHLQFAHETDLNATVQDAGRWLNHTEGNDFMQQGLPSQSVSHFVRTVIVHSMQCQKNPKFSPHHRCDLQSHKLDLYLPACSGF